MYGKSITSIVNAALAMSAHSGLPPALLSGFGYTGRQLRGTRGAGISMAQQQRAAKKARNVRRHKRSVRG